MSVGELAEHGHGHGHRAPRTALTPVLLGAFLAFAAAVRLVTAISLWRRGSLLDRIWDFRPREHVELIRVGGAAPALFFALSIVIAVTSVDCFGRRRWGWGFAVAIFTLDAAASAARGFVDSIDGRLGAAFIDGAAGAIFSVAVLWWLTRDSVRTLFDR
jgi:hypothetical protein